MAVAVDGVRRELEALGVFEAGIVVGSLEAGAAVQGEQLVAVPVGDHTAIGPLDVPSGDQFGGTGPQPLDRVG
ncbi:hypothetical protein [Streptomyces sp. NPDC058424]|uniref:hypothetical protein n=1 Tax=Streptomyces sp. NPDC058424 TaxID=3346491 RepID=UPI0036615296